MQHYYFPYPSMVAYLRHYEFIKNVMYDYLENNPGFVFFHFLSYAAQSTANKSLTSQVRGLYSADLFFEQLGTLI